MKPEVLENHMTVEDLLARMSVLEVSRAVVVQRAHVYGFDNAYVLSAVRDRRDRLAAVACLDSTAPAAGATAAALVAAGASGLRFTTAGQHAEDTAWLSGPYAVEVWKTAHRCGASLCVHLSRSNRDAGVAALVPLLARFPSVPLVLDHVGNPTSEGPHFGLSALDPLVSSGNVKAKISTINFGYVRKAGDDVADFTAAVVARFGAERVMWGSDVAQSHGDYAGFVADAQAAVASLPAGARDAVLGATAASVYFATSASARWDP